MSITSMPALVSKDPSAHIVTATKPLVDALLAMNTHNRRPKNTHIDRLALDCSEGSFLLTASGVGVSKTGILLDGQNRLMAIRKSGYPPVQFTLVTGLDEESQRVVDRHARRSLSDSLTIYMNVTVSTRMVALVNTLYEFGATCGISKPFVFQRGSSNPGLTDSHMALFMANHGDLTASVVSETKGARASVMAAIWVYAYHHHDSAMEFARQVATGVELSEDSPAYRLRTALQRLKNSQGASGRMELFKISAAACMAHYHNRKMQLLRPAESWAGSKWKWKIEGESIFADLAAQSESE
jgi:hypothetical protein